MSNSLFITESGSSTQTTHQMLIKKYGLGKTSATYLCRQTGICLNQNFSDFTSDQIEEITKRISQKNLIIEQELKKKLMKNLETSIKIKSYKGMRKIKGYPANGQRTRSNAKTARKKNFY